MFPLYYCDTCGAEEFNKSNIQRKHGQRTVSTRPAQKKICPGTIKKRQVSCTVPAEIFEKQRRSTSIEEYLQRPETLLVESFRFPERYLEIYGIAEYDAVFTMGAISRARLMFDRSLSKNSGHPEFWNWFRRGQQVIVIDRNLPGSGDVNPLKYMSVCKATWRDLAMRLVKMFVVTFCHPSSGKRIKGSSVVVDAGYADRNWYNQAIPGFTHLYVTGSELMLRGSDDTRFDKELKELMHHIELNLPTRGCVQDLPVPEGLSSNHINDLGLVDAGTNDMTVSVVFCGRCFLCKPSVSVWLIRNHIDEAKKALADANAGKRKMPRNHACASANIYRCRLKYAIVGEQPNIEGERSAMVSNREWMENHLVLGKPVDGRIAERRAAAKTLLQENPSELEFFAEEEVDLNTFINYIVWVYSHMYGKDAKSRFQSLYLTGEHLNVYMHDLDQRGDAIVQYPVNGIFILYGCLDKIVKWTKENLPFDRRDNLASLLDRRCLDCQYTWRDIAGLTFSDNFDEITLRKTHEQRMLDTVANATQLAYVCTRFVSCTVKGRPE